MTKKKVAKKPKLSDEEKMVAGELKKIARAVEKGDVRVYSIKAGGTGPVQTITIKMKDNNSDFAATLTMRDRPK